MIETSLKEPLSTHPYEVLGLLARGGMAEVYLGRRRLDGQAVALKRLHPAFVDDSEYQQMFFDEVRLMQALSGHANIVRFDGAGQLDGSRFMALELLEGLTLQQAQARCLAQRTPFPVEVALRVAIDVLDGLHHAHTRTDARGAPLGIVHRDVSPQNILIDWSGCTKILDFGVAMSTDRLHRTQPGLVKGKPPYMSPEQLRLHPIDARSDLFSLGSVLYELLTGRHPFYSRKQDEILLKIMMAQPEPLRGLVSHVPEDVAKVVHRALSSSPTTRYPSAGHMRDALKRTQIVPASREQVSRYLARLGSDTRKSVKDLSDTPLPTDVTWNEPDDLNPELQSVIELLSEIYDSAGRLPLSPEDNQALLAAVSDGAPAAAPDAEPAPEAVVSHAPFPIVTGSPVPNTPEPPLSNPLGTPIQAEPMSAAPQASEPEGAEPWYSLFRTPSPHVPASLLIAAAAILLVASVIVRLGDLPSTETYVVDSTPQGGRIFLAGKPTGLTTPTQFEQASGGEKVTLRVEREGYLPCSFEIMTRRAGRTRIDCELEVAP